jgi:hypothetical protein
MFMDLQAIWTACDAWSRGIDPLADPTFAFNYPRIWLALSKVGLQDLPLAPSALFLDAALLLCVLVLLRPRNWWLGLLVAGIVWSPPMRLILERVNIDLLVFLIVAAGAAFAARFSERISLAWIAPAIILFAALLKLYPLVILFAGFLFENGDKRVRRWWLWAALIGVLVMSLNAREIIEIGEKTLQSDAGSFGVTVLGTRTFNHFIGHGQSEPRKVAVAIRVASTVIFAIFGFFAIRMGMRQRAAFSSASESPSWSGFWVAAAVYVGTFTLGANFSYRLVFILLGIPFLLGLAREPAGSAAIWSRATLAIILIVMFSPFGTKGVPYTLIQFSQWLLALLLVAGVAAASPRDLGIPKEL